MIWVWSLLPLVFAAGMVVGVLVYEAGERSVDREFRQRDAQRAHKLDAVPPGEVPVNDDIVIIDDPQPLVPLSPSVREQIIDWWREHRSGTSTGWDAVRAQEAARTSGCGIHAAAPGKSLLDDSGLPGET